MSLHTLDTYTIMTRYYPTLIVIAPLCLAVLSLVADQYGLIKGLAAAAISGLGLGLLMDQLGRDKGRNKQEQLFQEWGGPPTTRYLRHKDPNIQTPTKARYHKILGKLLPDLKIPSKEEETKDPARADQIYASCVDYLRQATRDQQKFFLVFQENCNYGFRRNLWGMRPFGTIISLIGAASCAAVLAYKVQIDQPYLAAAICTLLNVTLSFFWIFCFNSNWVAIAADAYARRLLEACDSLDK